MRFSSRNVLALARFLPPPPPPPRAAAEGPQTLMAAEVLREAPRASLLCVPPSSRVARPSLPRYNAAMRIHDLMPSFERFVRRVEAQVAPGAEGPIASAGREADLVRAFEEEYVAPNRELLAPLLADWEAWSRPFAKTLQSFDPHVARRAIEAARRRGYPDRAARTLEKVEAFFGHPLEGDLTLIAGFGRLDGYARFERGKHVVYIGVDYPEEADHYLDLIIAHELGHVVREGDPRTWEALGLSVDMSHDEFQERCPFEEHMIGEGLSTALSEAIFPGHAPHEYLFFNEDQAAWCAAHDAEIRSALAAFRKTAEAHYNLYARDAVAPGSPERTQYYWGFRAVRRAVAAGRALRDLFRTPALEILKLAGED